MIGRQKELQILNKAYSPDKSEMIVVYRRRRIGKTYIIREFYAKKSNTFALTPTWQSGDDMKAKIDMLIKRADRFATIVECKYYNDTFVADEEYIGEL